MSFDPPGQLARSFAGKKRSNKSFDLNFLKPGSVSNQGFNLANINREGRGKGWMYDSKL